jgi:hypothetical protein
MHPLASAPQKPYHQYHNYFGNNIIIDKRSSLKPRRETDCPGRG